MLHGVCMHLMSAAAGTNESAGKLRHQTRLTSQHRTTPEGRGSARHVQQVEADRLVTPDAHRQHCTTLP